MDLLTTSISVNHSINTKRDNHSAQEVPRKVFSEDDFSSIMNNEVKKVTLNVGGTRFETLLDTCTKHGKNTMLGAMFLSLNAKMKPEYFIDRDPELFRAILQWYRTGLLFSPPGVPIQVMEHEVDFYGIPRSELKIFQKQFYLSGKKIWSCKSCGTHLADHRDIQSKMFQGNTGPAYLFDTVVNVRQGESKKKELMTGTHVVGDISCYNCSCYLGWTYEQALDLVNMYKVGKTILEKALIVKERNI